MIEILIQIAIFGLNESCCWACTSNGFSALEFGFVFVLIFYKMDIFRICRTCLNESHANLISIHSQVNPNEDDLSTLKTNHFENKLDESETSIISILDKLTGHKYVRNFYCSQNLLN